jgi:oxysterol-binding protein 1
MKFNGRYISFEPKDRVYITLKLTDGSQEFYSCTLPLTTVHNLVIGKLYIDVHGKTQVINHTTQETCDIDWKERGWTGKNANMMVGTVKSASGKPHYKVSGKFTEGLYLLNMESNEE